MNFDRFPYQEAEAIELFRALLLPRLIEEKMLKLLRQGQVSKWFSGIGQEAIAVGSTLALEPDEYIFPLHRNLGVFTSRGISLDQLLHQWKGSADGFTQGRDRSFHFGYPEKHVIGMISHLGAMLSVADGVALAHRLKRESKVSLAFCGDGGTSEGEFHEAINLAAVWELPVIFLIENNGYGLSTPSEQQYRCEHLADKGVGYGVESRIIDGNNLLEVYHSVKEISEDLRKNPRPFLLECKTFRIRGHEEASGTHYVPPQLITDWTQNDPIQNFREYLISKGVEQSTLDRIQGQLKQEIDRATKAMRDIPPPTVDTLKELTEVYAPIPELPASEAGPVTDMRFIDAIKNGLEVAMERYDDLVLMGQDIGHYGGVFKITEGLHDRYGDDRVRNTPISEAAPLGAALGLSIAGMRSMVEMQFADFVSCGFNQIANNLAKTHYRWGQSTHTVIRMPTGGGAAAGPFHSQSTEAWFFHIPGLKILYPSTPADAKGLLLAAFHDPNPVLFFEHKYLYRNSQGPVPSGYYLNEIGKARVEGDGSEICFISYGWATDWCRDLVKEKQLDARIVDLCSLLPWDKEAVRSAVQACNKVVVVHEAGLTGGIGAEIAAWISEHCFEWLDAPVRRVAGLDTPIPFHPELENNYMGSSRLAGVVNELLAY